MTLRLRLQGLGLRGWAGVVVAVVVVVVAVAAAAAVVVVVLVVVVVVVCGFLAYGFSLIGFQAGFTGLVRACPKALLDVWSRGSDLCAEGSGLEPRDDVPGL